MHRILLAILMLLFPLTPVVAQLSINFNQPGVSIGVNFGVYPTLQRVPGYPVYYAPGLRSNYFFYDGLYWVYEGDNWYSSSWYNGPWWAVDPYDVPLYVLRVPVRYYRHAPAYFHGWSANSAPRWGDHWGQSWQQRRSGWDRWNHNEAPPLAPLPTYQRQYTGNRYPQVQQQAVIQTQNYRYQPKDPVAQQHFQQQRTVAQTAPQPQRAPLQPEATKQPPQAAPRQQGQRPPQEQPRQQPAAPRPQREQKASPQQPQAQPQQQQPAAPQRVQRQQQPAPQPVQRPQAPKERPQQAEQKIQKAPPQREQRAPPPQAQQRAPQPKEQAKGKGPAKDDEKDNKGKGQGR